MQKITPFLWFDSNAEEAVNFYVSIFKNSKVGKVTRKQVLDIVKLKSKDMNTTNDEAAFKVIAGTARSMGIEIVG